MIRTIFVFRTYKSLLAVVFLNLTTAAQAGAAQSIIVNNARALGGEDRIPRFLGVQGDLYSAEDPKEAQAWHDLHLFSDTLLQIFDQDGYNTAGMQVYRGATRPTATAKQVAGTDLWIDPAKFDGRLKFIRETLRIDARRMVLSINMMPKVLASLPEDSTHAEKLQKEPNWWVGRNPRSMDEWRTVLKEIGEMLCNRGFCEREGPPVRVMLFHEAESEPGYMGNRIEKLDWGTLDDYVDLYVATQEAMQSVMRTPEPVTIYASGTGVYSGKLHTQLSGYERPLNGDHIIRRLHERHPNAHFSGFAYQLYRFGGKDLLLGDGSIRVGAEYLKSKLASYGDHNVRIACFGYHGAADDLHFPKDASPDVKASLRKKRAPRLVLNEAAFLAANLADLLNPKVDHPLYEATYYSFNFDVADTEQCNPDGAFVYTSLVATVHPGYDDCGPQHNESNVHCFRPMGLVMKAIAEGRTGTFVEHAMKAGDRRYQATALRLKDGALRILYAHRDGKDLPKTTLQLKGLVKNSNYKISIRALRAEANLCASWEGVEEKNLTADGSGQAALTIDAANSPVLMVEARKAT